MIAWGVAMLVVSGSCHALPSYPAWVADRYPRGRSSSVWWREGEKCTETIAVWADNAAECGKVSDWLVASFHSMSPQAVCEKAP